jgi:AcrR family transcriptional regulator
MPTTGRPLRKDAERNRLRILEAARVLFAERGLGVTLNDIAHHAGVGVGTVYRRFPDKDRLIEELFELRVAEIVGLAKAALDDPDPWNGLTGFLTKALELQAEDAGFKEVVLGSPGARERIGQIRLQMFPIGVELVRRAQEAGQLRSDFFSTDVPIIQLMVGTVIDTARDVEPELWRRYLAIVLAGLRPGGERTDPMPIGNLDPERVQRVMSSWQPPRHR